MSITVQRAVEEDNAPRDACLRRYARAAMRVGSPAAAVCLRLVDDAEGRALNARYRGRDYATNVLSFAGEPDAGILGDLALCAPVVHREAQEQGKALEAHWAHMVIHGILHLQGYDHHEPAQAQRMEGLERHILAGFGFGDPYCAEVTVS